MKRKKIALIPLSLWIITLLVVSSILGSFSRGSVDSWYQTLNRSPLTPPDFVFGLVWTVLYILIAISGYLLWQAKKTRSVQVAKALFIVALLLNWCWTPLFFIYHQIAASFFLILAIAALVLGVILLCLEKLKSVSYLLLPYFLWLLFAGYLNLYIWL